MSEASKPRTNLSSVSDLTEDVVIMRQVMEKDWVALRALALGDVYPDLDAAALVRMAEEEKALRQSNS